MTLPPQSSGTGGSGPPHYKGESPAETRLGWKMAGMGFQVASEVAAGTLLGWLFDKWRGSGNIGVIVGASAGILVGLWSLIRNAYKLNRELDAVSPKRERIEYPPEPPPSDEDDGWDKKSEDKDDWDRPRTPHS
jgi:F0F1-type ATP synthase assembly protein I